VPNNPSTRRIFRCRRCEYAVLERFLRYVAIDTQSDPASTTCPSTEKQKILGRLLADELMEMGLADAHLDEHDSARGFASTCLVRQGSNAWFVRSDWSINDPNCGHLGKIKCVGRSRSMQHCC
jgi:hypothetical protein